MQLICGFETAEENNLPILMRKGRRDEEEKMQM
jgi:hypothetical protein